MLIGFDTYTWSFLTEFVQEKGNTGGWRCPVVRCLLGPDGDLRVINCALRTSRTWGGSQRVRGQGVVPVPSQ